MHLSSVRSRWPRKLRAGHQGRGINWGVKLKGVCCDCGMEILEKDTFVADGIEGERCKWCYARFVENF